MMDITAVEQHPLNSQQKQAAEYGGKSHIDSLKNSDGIFTSDPLLIIAGAGTGKTNTLAHRTAHLILQGVKRMYYSLYYFRSS